MSGRLRHVGSSVGAIALSMLAAACASTGAAPKPFPMPNAPVARRPLPPLPPPPAPGEPVPESPVETSGDMVVRAALELRGTPYREGGTDPRGFDCSGFTSYVFAHAGTALPRETRDQYLAGTPVLPGEQRPGDLIFFTTTAPGASHVGIALGGDAFVHAPSSRGVVRVEQLTLPYWSSRLVGIRRIVAN